MTSKRAIPVALHAGIETLAAPLLMAAPFLLGFGRAATFVCVAVGAVLLGIALQLPGPQRSVPLSFHASMDYALALFAAVAGIALGVATAEWATASFLVGVGVALAALTASTRFSSARGA
jgi:hypothetical protein